MYTPFDLLIRMHAVIWYVSRTMINDEHYQNVDELYDLALEMMN